MHIGNRTVPDSVPACSARCCRRVSAARSAAVVLVLLTLAWKWLVTLSGLAKPPADPALRLETISISHFVEKVRWSLDRLGVPYEEEHTAGILGALFRGRTVPRLYVTTGRVTSVIGNSPEIQRYLWGRYGVEQGKHAAFLQPTAAAVELEHKFDEYGVDLQRWIYSHILSHKELLFTFGGARIRPCPPGSVQHLPFFTRCCVSSCSSISSQPSVKQTSREGIERVLGDVEERLADGQTNLLGGPLSFVDITFAALFAPWVDPEAYGAGKAAAVRPRPQDIPPDMLRDITT